MNGVILPPAASAKLSLLAQQADDLDALASAALAQVKSAEATLANILRAADTPEEKAEAEGFAAQLEKLRVVQTERQQRSAAAKQLVTRLRGWAERLPPGTALAMAPEEEPEPGEPRESVTKYRELIASHKSDLVEIAAAPLDRSQVLAGVYAWLDRRAALGAPHIQTDQDRVEVLFQNQKALVRGDRLNAPVSADFLIWAFKDALATALARAINELPIEGSLTREQRALMSAQRHELIVGAERAEEAAIERASAEGQFIARRPDASPAAVIGIEFVGAVETQAA